MQLEIIPDWSTSGHAVDLLPVDFVAKAITSLTEALTESLPIVATLAQLNSVPLSSLIASFLSLYDDGKRRYEVVSHERWHEALADDAKRGNDNALAELLPLLSSSPLSSLKFSTAQADGSNFKRLLCLRAGTMAIDNVSSVDTLLPTYVAWMKSSLAQPHNTFIPMRS